jgi:hypothetical protein
MDSRTEVIVAEKARPMPVITMTPERAKELAAIRAQRPGYSTDNHMQCMLDAMATGPVTVIEAERHLGIRNAPDIVFRLRKLSVHIVSETVAYFDEYGNKRKTARYALAV